MALAPITDSSDLATLLANLRAGTDIFAGRNSTETTSGNTVTEQTILSPEAIGELIKQLLSGSQGLAAISGMQGKSGLYNSTTNLQLVNDLLARIAGNVAVASAPKVRTTSGSTKNTSTAPAISPGKAAAALGAGALANKALKSIFGDDSTKSNAGEDDFNKFMGELHDNLQKELENSPIGDDFLEQLLSTMPEIVIGDESTPSSDGYGGDNYDNLGNYETADGYGGDNYDNMGTQSTPTDDYPLDDRDTYDNSDTSDTSWIDDILSGGDGGSGDSEDEGCFITTAVCKYLGKPDDCDELQTLRAYRDSWMRENQPADVVEYYKEAPALVAKLEAKGSSSVFFKYLYDVYILQALIHIEDGKPELAHSTYKEMYEEVREAANG